MTTHLLFSVPITVRLRFIKNRSSKAAVWDRSAAKKGSLREGGFRVPGIFRWPRQIPAGKTSHQVVTTMDLLPTCAKTIGADLPKDPIDGHEISTLLRNPETTRSPSERFFYYHGQQLHAVRSGDWKFWPRRGKTSAQLYNLKSDPAEQYNVAAQEPEIVKRLAAHIQHARYTLGDSPGQQGAALRPRGELP